MKNISIFGLILTAIMLNVSCSSNGNLFDQTAAERLNEASDLYSARLWASPNGWAMQLYPTTDDEAPYGSGYLVLLKFNSDNSVYAAMDNVLSGGKFMEDQSVWEIITDDGPVLSFDTYNKVIHRFSNPEDESYWSNSEIASNHGIGTGIGGDYEYIIVDAPSTGGYMMLKGKKRGTYNLLTPIAEGVEYEDYLADVKAFHGDKFPYPMRVAGGTGEDSVEVYNASDLLHIGDKTYTFEDANGGVPAIYPYGGDKVTETFFDPFLITKRGDDYYLRFRDELDSITGAQDFKYDMAGDRFVCTDNASCYLEGGKAIDEIRNSLNNSLKWQTNMKSSMSESMATVFAGIDSELKAAKYTFVRFMFSRNSDKKFVLTATVKSTKATANLTYLYNLTYDGSNMVLAFDSYGSTASETIFKTAPSLQKIKEFLEGTIAVSPAATAFNLSRIKLAKGTEDWLLINLDKNLNK